MDGIGRPFFRATPDRQDKNKPLAVSDRSRGEHRSILLSTRWSMVYQLGHAKHDYVLSIF